MARSLQGLKGLGESVQVRGCCGRVSVYGVFVDEI